MILQGKYALITGGSHGLGKAIAKEFLKEGASVMICGRNQKCLNEVKTELSSFSTGASKILIQAADVSSRAQVERLVKKTLQKFGRLDILVNNAGIYGPKGELEKTNWKDWEETIRINLFGAVYLCQKLLPQFKKQKHGKIINLSGGGATKPMPRLSAYAASKAALVRFTETLAEELSPLAIDVNAVAPGALNTKFLDEVLKAGPKKVGKEFYESAVQQKKEGGAPLENAAALCVFLASRKSDGITGKLISAVWDSWETLDQHQQELKSSDIYTLRRIMPDERGQSWGKRSV